MTALDTAYNYHRFTSHRALARTAADLLPNFILSTKVGYFPDGHSLDPGRLHKAVGQSAEDLGRIPDTVLLHNPEHSPDGLPQACAALAEMREKGLCRAWGIATWDPRPLLEAPGDVPEPDVLMVRAGLAVPGTVLDAAEELAGRLRPREQWGMAPFAGNATDPIWATVDTTLFLVPGQQATPLQAGVAAAFALPQVSRLAIGTSRLDHLAELASTATLEADAGMVKRYRTLLRQTATVNHRDRRGGRTDSAAPHG